MNPINLIRRLYAKLSFIPEPGEEGEARYARLRRNITLIMFLLTLSPLTIMVIINHYQYKNSLTRETINQLRVVESKTKHSFQLFLQERLSAVQYIANAYTAEELSSKEKLREIFYALQENYTGFVDLGLINKNGLQVNYIGPYNLENKDYSQQSSYQEVRIKGNYITDVFLGHRKFPHIAIAVEKRSPKGESWVIRSTINIDNFNEIIAAIRLGSKTDAFLMNKNGVIQTPSKFYGHVLDKFPMEVPPQSFEPTVIRTTDSRGAEVFLCYVYFPRLEYILIITKPISRMFESWYALRGQIIAVFFISVAVICFVILKLSHILTNRIKNADEKREIAFRELEHTQKLSSIGRMAAGVAHEINNPLAIVNEKAGLMQDIINNLADFPQKDKFLSLVESILNSVQRARGITYRLLGFARRLEVQHELLNVNQVIQEVIGFLANDAKDRNIEIQLDLDEQLDKISTDQGQLEQVLLNILNNAVAAIEEDGRIMVRTWEESRDQIGISIQDNGVGMSQETVRHIFEPFFTTKKGYGTGLGLSITYGIVKKLGGCIRVKSQEQVGTTFYVYLPKNQNI